MKAQASVCTTPKIQFSFLLRKNKVKRLGIWTHNLMTEVLEENDQSGQWHLPLLQTYIEY